VSTQPNVTSNKNEMFEQLAVREGTVDFSGSFGLLVIQVGLK
jgi:hypothetical protein